MGPEVLCQQAILGKEGHGVPDDRDREDAYQGEGDLFSKVKEMSL